MQKVTQSMGLFEIAMIKGVLTAVGEDVAFDVPSELPSTTPERHTSKTHFLTWTGSAAEDETQKPTEGDGYFPVASVIQDSGTVL